MEITKIKIKQSQVAIDYNKMVIVDDHESINKYSIVSPEHPTVPFKLAFQKMDFFLIEMCELCGNLDEIPIMCEDVKITGLSFKYEEGSLSGAVITGTKALAYSNSPLVLNSPHKSVNFGGEWNKMAHLTDPCIAALYSVIEQAKKYVGGERLQVEMEFDEKEETTHITDPLDEGRDDIQNAELGPIGDGAGVNTTKDVRDDSDKGDERNMTDWENDPENPDSPNFIDDTEIPKVPE